MKFIVLALVCMEFFFQQVYSSECESVFNEETVQTPSKVSFLTKLKQKKTAKQIKNIYVSYLSKKVEKMVEDFSTDITFLSEKSDKRDYVLAEVTGNKVYVKKITQQDLKKIAAIRTLKEIGVSVLFKAVIRDAKTGELYQVKQFEQGGYVTLFSISEVVKDKDQKAQEKIKKMYEFFSQRGISVTDIEFMISKELEVFVSYLEADFLGVPLNRSLSKSMKQLFNSIIKNVDRQWAMLKGLNDAEKTPEQLKREESEMETAQMRRLFREEFEAMKDAESDKDLIDKEELQDQSANGSSVKKTDKGEINLKSENGEKTSDPEKPKALKKEPPLLTITIPSKDQPHNGIQMEPSALKILLEDPFPARAKKSSSRQPFPARAKKSSDSTGLPKDVPKDVPKDLLKEELSEYIPSRGQADKQERLIPNGEKISPEELAQQERALYNLDASPDMPKDLPQDLSKDLSQDLPKDLPKEELSEGNPSRGQAVQQERSIPNGERISPEELAQQERALYNLDSSPDMPKDLLKNLPQDMPKDVPQDVPKDMLKEELSEYSPSRGQADKQELLSRILDIMDPSKAPTDQQGQARQQELLSRILDIMDPSKAPTDQQGQARQQELLSRILDIMDPSKAPTDQQGRDRQQEEVFAQVLTTPHREESTGPVSTSSKVVQIKEFLPVPENPAVQ